MGVFDEVLDQQDYDDLVDADNGRIAMTPETAGGWIGITDKYWLTALVPDQQTKASFSYNHWQDSNRDNFQVDFHYIDSLTIPAGDSGTISNRVFTGAKVVRLLDGYKNNLGVPGFDRAVDFGLLFFLTKPMFILLRFLSETIGNFGIAILLVTVIVKVIFFPLANRSYRAMSKMKKLGPEMAKIRERFKDDRQRAAARDDGALQERRRQPRFGLPSHLRSDSCIFCAVQGLVCDHRNAAHAVFLDGFRISRRRIR